jgi:hypothetical protein
MNHNKYKEWIQLYLYDELDENSRAKLLEHLAMCNECSAGMEKQKAFLDTIARNKLSDADESLLNEARRELNAALRVERSKGHSSLFNKFRLMEFFSSPLRVSFSGAVVLAVGLMIGYFLFSNPDVSYIEPKTLSDNASLLNENVRITNLRFINQNISDGEVEFIFDAVKPVHIKGKVNDPQIQNILTFSMLYEQNPAVRLNAIYAMGSSAKQDEELKTALITVAKYDTNAGVRREALKLLRSFSYDKEIKEALLYILFNDENSAMRIEAINNLKEAHQHGLTFNTDELSIFKESLKSEDNDYIRYVVNTVLKEDISNEQ